MFQERRPHRLLKPLGIGIMILSGCNEDNARLAQLAEEASRRQAAQNQEVVRVNREVAEGVRHLVQSRGDADEQLLKQQELLQKQRDQLDLERRGIAGDRVRDSILAPVLLTVGTLLVCSLPLVLCWFLLSRLGQESTTTDVNQLLVDFINNEHESGLSANDEQIGLPAQGKKVGHLAIPIDSDREVR